MTGISFDQVHVVFESDRGSVEAIREASASAPSGTFVSVIGPSGCGKSTLLDIASGLLSPTSGSAAFAGETITGPRSDMAMVFQEAALLPWRSLLDNVAFGLEVAGKSKSDRREIARDFIQMVGLGGFENQRPHELSGGMRQRAAIARALAVQPALLLMDEPFGALDQQTREHLGQELTGIWERTRPSVLFVTHDIHEAILLSDEVWVMGHRPSTIVDRVTVDLERPRRPEVVTTDSFAALSNRLWETLRAESLKSFAGGPAT